MKVKFWPKQTGISVAKCNHRFGAEMTYTVQTDSRFESSIYAAEMYAFKHNIRIGAFVNNQLGGQYNLGLKEQEETGVVRNDVYYSTDFWKNPSTGAIEVIPDYYSTTWTVIGAAYFDVTPGSPKTARFPRHGQNMFDLSSGRLGYDFTNGAMGTNQLEEVYGIDRDMQDWFYQTLGRYPSSLSYRNGDNSGALTHLNNWIAGRNSFPSPTNLAQAGPSQYGSGLGSPSEVTNRNLFINLASSSRSWDAIYNEGKNQTEVLTYEKNGIVNALDLAGWFRIFIHFHSMQANGTLSYFDTLYNNFYQAVGDAFVWKCSVGEAMEYMFLREITDRVVANEINGKVFVTADLVDKFKNLETGGYSQKLPLDRLNIPLSVEIDLSNTALSGKAIKASSGKVVSLGSNVYIVEIPFNHKEGFSGIVIEEGPDGIYNTSIPTASALDNGDVLTVTSDMPTKCVLFGVTEGGAEYNSLPAGRSNEFSLEHKFSIETGKNYRVGIISEFLQTDLITI